MQPLLLKKNKLTIHQRILEYKMLIKFTDQNQNKDDKLDFRQKSWKIHVNFSALGTRSEKNGIMWEKFSNWGGGGLTQTHFLMSIYQVIFGMPK